MIYLDHAATTPCDPRVIEAMRPYFSEVFGNPSSVHIAGQRAEAAIEDAREVVATVLGCQPAEVVFTSCGTESDNLALRGAAMARRLSSGATRIVTARVEHPAVITTVEQLVEYYGFEVGWLEVDFAGRVSPESASRLIDEKTAVVSVMYANNEIGTINTLREIAAICGRRGVPFHTDAVQAAAYLPVRVDDQGVDLLSLGGHKLHAPKGVGALYVRKGTELVPSMTGGGQESGLRPGTPNVPYIVGFATALRLADAEREQRVAHVKPLRDQVIGTVLEVIADSRLTGSADLRLPNHASFAFQRVDGNLLLTLLDAAGFACSSGSACKTGNPEPSEVMRAIGLQRDWGLGSLRVTLGKDTTPAEVSSFLDVLPGLVERARELSRLAA